VSGATAVFFLVGGLVGLPVARVIARRDPRPLIAAGAVACAAALLLLGRRPGVAGLRRARAVRGRLRGVEPGARDDAGDAVVRATPVSGAVGREHRACRPAACC
jgi:hypothetical protein